MLILFVFLPPYAVRLSFLEEIKCERNIKPKAYLPLLTSENICTFNFNCSMILKPVHKLNIIYKSYKKI